MKVKVKSKATLLIFLFLLLFLDSACVQRVRSGAVPVPSLRDQLASADALLRAGCYDCLVQALAVYRQIAIGSSDPAAMDGVRETAGLLAIRERALGLIDQHYLDGARNVSNDPAAALWFDVIAALPRRYAGAQRATDESEIQLLAVVNRNREAWRTQLWNTAGTSALAAVTAVSFECTYGGSHTASEFASLLDRTGTFKDTALIQFTTAACSRFDNALLTKLLETDPRFAEIDYFLGLTATMSGDFEQANQRFQRAIEWRQDWPAVTLAVADVAMREEDFDRAVDFYDRTLTLVLHNADARRGRLRALSYGGHHVAALGAANDLLAGRWYVGDAYYWRAWNEAQLNQNDDAWSDIHEAAKLMVNAQVPKLTGILAIRRGDLARALTEFEQARLRNPGDCETAILLGGTQLELRRWQVASPTLLEAIGCLDRRDDDLRAEIARFDRMTGRERMIAHRGQELEGNRRLRVQSWFNLAIAAFNLGDAVNARTYAGRITTDDQFGERARQLIERLQR